MKRILAIILLILVCTCGYAQKHKYVVGFYNLENLFDTYDDPAKNDEEFLPEGANKWTQAKYETKLANMARVIADMKKDNGAYHTLLGVSEIENRLVLEDLVSQEVIADANFQIVHYDGPDARGVDVALLYRPDQFQYLDSESIPFDFENSEIEFLLDEEEKARFKTRDILMVHGKIEDEDVAVYVAHLPSRIGGKGQDLRPRGAEIIYNHSKNLTKQYPDIKIIVMGDMNDNPTDESMVKWMHSKAKVEETAEGEFFSPFIKMLADGYGSLAYQGTWNIYDIILVNSNLAKQDRDNLHICKLNRKGHYGRIFKKNYMTQQTGQYKGTPFRTFSNGSFIGGYSDHYPTYIVIGK